MAKSIEDGFNEFLRRLAPLNSEYQKSISHKKSVKSSLKKKFKCAEFFETGSFGNKTGVKHFSDTDYFAVCPDEDLRSNSKTLLIGVKKGLQHTFHKTSLKIKVNSPSVVIPFGKFASENLEITPCFYNGLIQTPVGRKKSYGIPDGNGGWILSSPRAHKSYVTLHHERLQRKLKPLVTLIKAWKFFNQVPISSFYLELRITKLLEDKKKIDYAVDLFGTIKKLRDVGLADIQDPMGVSGFVGACKTDLKKKAALTKIKMACSRAEKAYLSRNGDLNDCFYWLKMLYKGKFPSR